MSRYHWGLLGLLTGFWGLVGINRLGIQFIFPAIVPAFTLTTTQVSLRVTAPPFRGPSSTGGPAWLPARFGRRSGLCPGGLFACLPTFLQAVAANFLSR